MHRCLAILCALLFLSSSACKQESVAREKNTEAELLASIRARMDAVARNDTKAWSQFVADDMLAPLPANDSRSEVLLRSARKY
jgi:hypothetical protein